MTQVSVIIPTYNHRDYVAATLGSVLAQTFNDYEIIVVNDGSTDDTANVLKSVVGADRIRYIEQPNGGPSAARNRGIAEARGEFIALLDDDDLWPADKLEWQVELMRLNPQAVLVYGCMEAIGEMRPYRHPGADAPSGWVLDRFLSDGWIRSPGQTLIRKSALDEIDGFDPRLWGTDDWDLYIRLSGTGEFVFQDRLALLSPLSRAK